MADPGNSETYKQEKCQRTKPNNSKKDFISKPTSFKLVNIKNEEPLKGTGAKGTH